MSKQVTDEQANERASMLLARLRAIRKRRGLNQAELGEIINRHQKTISRYESQEDLGTEIRSIARLCEGLNVRLYPLDMSDELVA